MIENIRLSLRGIWTHKMRSFLTMLGVIIGIASIIAIVSIVEGTNKKLETSLVGSGNNVTNIQLCQDSYPYDFSAGIPTGIPVVSNDAMKQIKQITGVTNASAYRSRQDYNGIYYKNRSISNSYVYGISKDYFKTVSYKVTSGRDMTQKEYQSTSKVCIIDQSVVDALFNGANPLGEVIEISSEPFIVVGVATDLNAKTKEYSSLNDYYMYGSTDGGGKIYVSQDVWPLIYQFDEPQSVALHVSDTKQMNAIASQAATDLNSFVTNKDLTYSDASAQGNAEELETITNAIKAMLISIASLSLLVGGIGVMNIMLVSVTERTSEIGLKKALGARRRMITVQFLTESAVLTSIGGIFGVILGIILAKIISVVASLEFAVNIPSIFVAVLFSMGIGILFGAMPAHKASKMNPIDALRRE